MAEVQQNLADGVMPGAVARAQDITALREAIYVLTGRSGTIQLENIVLWDAGPNSDRDAVTFDTNEWGLWFSTTDSELQYYNPTLLSWQAVGTGSGGRVKYTSFSSADLPPVDQYNLGDIAITTDGIYIKGSG